MLRENRAAEGASSASFPIATTPTTATTVATISAVHGEVTKTADLTVETQTPPAPLELQSLTLSRASIVGGRSATGRVTLSGLAPAGGIEVALSSDASSASVPASVTVLEGRSGATFTISTTAVSASATATITAAYEGVVKTAQLRVTPRFEITNIQNGDVLSGYVQVQVAAYDGAIGMAEMGLEIDGAGVASSDPGVSDGVSRPTFFNFQTKDFANGTHTLTVTDSVSSDTRTVSFSNDIANLNYNSIFDTSGVDDMPSNAHITAQVSDPDNSPAWKVEIKNDEGNLVKTFSVSVSVANPNIDVTWNGTNDAGVEAPDGTYVVVITPNSSVSLGASSKRRRNGVSRNRNRLHSAGTGGGTGSSAGGSRPSAVINKHKISDHLLLIDAGAVVGGEPVAVDYASYIRRQCSYTPALYSSRETLVVNDVRIEKEPWLRNRISSQLTQSNTLVYVLSHGTPFRPGFRLGVKGKQYFWVSSLRLEEPGFDNPRYTDVSLLVAPLNYDEDDGTAPPTMVWMDNCLSAGPGYGNDDLKWRDIYGISPLSWGAFVGTRGICAQYGMKLPDGSTNNFDIWRHNFWNFLMVGGNNIQTAHRRATSITPTNSTVNPGDVYKWWGYGHSSFGF